MGNVDMNRCRIGESGPMDVFTMQWLLQCMAVLEVGRSCVMVVLRRTSPRTATTAVPGGPVVDRTETGKTVPLFIKLDTGTAFCFHRA